MKLIDNIINSMAAFAFMMALCTLESNLIGSTATIIIAGTWLICRAWMHEEEHRKREGR